MDFVRRHADQPFFLYLPVTIPHGVHEVPNLLQYRDRDWPLAMKVYAAMVTRLDNAVGELVDLLKARGIFDNTLLVFASDNGYSFRDQGDEQTTLAEFFDHAGPFKGAKGNLHQGGVRVPAFAHWPGRIEPGTVNDTPWAFCDWLPTACDLLDRPVPDGVDGVSMLPTWTGRTDEQADRELLYWEFRDEQAARLGPWWVRRDDPTRPVEVYHADDDPAETTDRAAELPDVVARAEAIFASQHAPSDYFPDPGESQESWWDRLRANGLTPAHNVMG
jgi:arylsulfatase A-like enzyme